MAGHAPTVEVGAEACLSIADVEGDVPRWQHVRCSAQTLDGERVELSASHFAARLLQHEIDHLDGKLFIDRISRLKRSRYVLKRKKQLAAEREEAG